MTLFWCFYYKITASVPPISAGGIKKNQNKNKKKSASWVLKSLCHRYLPGGNVSYLKRLYKMKYGFKSSIFKFQSWAASAKQPINV